MPRTFVPEEQKRVDNLTELKDDIRPTPERVVTVESDADGLPNKFYWDQGADAANADGVSDIESNISLFADGGSEEGLWRRIIEPITSQTASTDDLTEGSNNLYYTDTRVKNDFQAGGDINYNKNTFSGEFDLSTASFSGTNFDVGNETTSPTGVAFNGDGTKMFVVGSGNNNVNEYNLTTGFDVSTASFSNTSFDASSEDGDTRGVAFNGDGTKMFVVGSSNNNIYEYDLTTGFDVSTASFSGTSFNVSEESLPLGLAFNDDGTKMFVVGKINDNVYEYNLTTGFDLSTASFSGTSFDVSSEESIPSGIQFNGDGTKMFVVGSGNDNVYEYDLNTGFDVSTASFTQSFDVSSEDGTPLGLTFNGDGTKMFVVGFDNDDIYEYNVGSPSGPAEFSLDVSALSPSDLFGSKTTDDLSEGSTNQYFTDERAQDAVGTILSGQLTYDDGTPEITLNQGDGSGLNADQLDGFEESAFAKLDDNETITGDYIFDGSTTIGTSGSLALNDNKITGVGDPINAKDAANKRYVDAVEQALDLKDSVRVASTGNIDLASSTDPNPIDGVTLSDGDRVLLKDQTTASENGIYVAQTATDPSTWTRSADADEDVEVTAGLYTFVEEGTDNADNGFVLTTNDPITVGTTDLAFTQFSGAGQVIPGDGLSKSGNTLDIVAGDIAGTGLKEDTSNPPNITVEPDDFAGSGLEDDGSDNLQLVNDSVTVTAGDGLKNGGTVALGGTTTIDVEPADFAGNGLVDDGSDDLELDIGVVDNGSDVTTSTSVYDLNFGDSLTVTDNTGTTAGRVTVDVDAADSTSIDVDDGGSDVATGVNNLNFGTNISATDDGSGKVTINGQSNAEIQDAVFTTGTILSGTEDRITVSYDDTNNELDFTVENDLSNYSFSNVTTNDISEGSRNLYYTDARVKNDFQAGGDINYSKNLLSGQFDLSTASFSGISFDVGSEEPSPQGVTFNGDGTKMFVVGGDKVYEYDLTTGFDLLTASFSGTSFDVSSEESIPLGLAFNDDGTKMFVSGPLTGSVYEYDLTTGFDLSTASFSGTSFDVSSEDGVPQGVTFNGDGTKMFISGSNNNSVYEYDLTTGFDLSTASFSNTSFDVSSEDGDTRGVQFNSDGTKMFVVGSSNNNVYEYDLTTGFDVSTASLTQSFDVSSQTSDPRGVAFNGEGLKMFVVGNINNNVYEYDVGLTKPAKFSLDVSSLSASDLFGSKTSDDLPEGSSNLYYTRERTEDDVNALLTGGTNINLTYTDNGTSAGDLTIDVDAAGSTSIDIDDGGSDVTTGVNNIDFGTELAVTDNGGGSVTVDFDAVAIDEMGQATFSGDGTTEQFTISHSLGTTPNSWMVHPTTDDGSTPSHTTADSSHLTVNFDTPPPSGTENIVLNYIIQG
jgi:WD40 repeat protein